MKIYLINRNRQKLELDLAIMFHGLDLIQQSVMDRVNRIFAIHLNTKQQQPEKWILFFILNLKLFSDHLVVLNSLHQRFD